MLINIKYLCSFLLLFITEVFIAVFVHDNIIRPYVGDILVIILMYTFFRAILKKPAPLLPVYLFAFAVLAELSQYFRMVERLGLQGNKILSMAMGTAFDIKDILCYLAGMVLLLIWQGIENGKR